MPSPATERQQPRGERIIPGLWRLRLPLPWSGIPHCNAWVVDRAEGDGHVLFDCGLHTDESFQQLCEALTQIGKRIEETKLLVCTHAHVDHYGQAKSVVDAAGCELWMHPNHEHMTASLKDPERLLEQRVAVGRESGVPEELLQHYKEAGATPNAGVAGLVTPDRDLVDGVTVETAVGTWTAVETPGHAPSHVSLFQADRRLLLAGDHILGRVALYYDYGWTDDPVQQYLDSLDRVEQLDARLCLPGHGKSFTDIRGHIEAHRDAALGRLDRVEDVVKSEGPATAIEMIPKIYGRPLSEENAGWLISETLCYLRHLQRRGVVQSGDDPDHPRWTAA